MSQINDALKRASQFQQQQEDTVRISIKLPSAAELKSQPTRASKPASKRQPSRDSTPASASKPGHGSVLPVVVILLIATAVVYIWLTRFGRRPISHVTTAAAVSQQVHAAAVPPVHAVTVPPPVHAVAVPKPASPPVTGQAVEVIAPGPMTPLPIKVQGIYSYNGKWQAIVNNRTVYVGDAVDGFRVAAISRNNVSFIAPDGSQRTLGLGE
jgi:hypothetical protein